MCVGWEQVLEPYQVFRGLVHLPDPHIISLETWFQNSQIFENSNTEFEICCFLLKSQLVFHFWYLFFVCICVYVHICMFHTPHSIICLVSLFFSWLITNVPILCTFNNILQLCQKRMPCLLMHNFEKSFHFE